MLTCFPKLLLSGNSEPQRLPAPSALVIETTYLMLPTSHSGAGRPRHIQKPPSPSLVIARPSPPGNLPPPPPHLPMYTETMALLHRQRPPIAGQNRRKHRAVSEEVSAP